MDPTASYAWDASRVDVLDAITTKYERKGNTVEIHGLHVVSAAVHGRLTGRLS